MANPVDLDEAKRHLRILSSADDALIQAAIDDAAAWVEAYTGHLLTDREIIEEITGFQSPLRGWPVSNGAAISVAYSAADGSSVPVVGARLLTASRPARIAPALGMVWPGLPRGSIVTVTYRAGYGENDAVPGNIRRAMLLMISAYYEDREGGDVFQKAEVCARRQCSSLRRRIL